MQQEYRARFGAWVERERVKRGYESQRAFAKVAGIHFTRINRIEGGQASADANTVRKIAAGLEVPDVVALIEAGYVRSLSPELASLCAEVERLPALERRAVIAALAGMVSALMQRTAGQEERE